MATPLSIVMIVKNEEKYLKRCLDSVCDWVDEIIILDSHSTDATEKIARSYAKVKFIQSETPWPGFGPQRNIAAGYARNDYVFVIDADEYVSDALREDILKTLEHVDNTCVYSLYRADYFHDKLPHRYGKHVRLYNRQYYAYGDMMVHESVDIKKAKTVWLKGELIHQYDGGFRYFQEKLLRYSVDWAEGQYAKGKRATIMKAFLHACVRFFRLYIIDREIFQGGFGFMYSWMLTNFVFNKYAALWSIERFPTNKK